MKTSCLRLKLVELNFSASFTTDDQSIFNISSYYSHQSFEAKWYFSLKISYFSAFLLKMHTFSCIVHENACIFLHFHENACIFPSVKCMHFHLICIKCTHFRENGLKMQKSSFLR